MKILLGTNACMLYWRNYIKSKCAVAGFHCNKSFHPGRYTYRRASFAYGQNKSVDYCALLVPTEPTVNSSHPVPYSAFILFSYIHEIEPAIQPFQMHFVCHRPAWTNEIYATWWSARNAIVGQLIVDLVTSQVAEGGARVAIETTIANVIDSMLNVRDGGEADSGGR